MSQPDQNPPPRNEAKMSRKQARQFIRCLKRLVGGHKVTRGTGRQEHVENKEMGYVSITELP